MEWAFDFRQEAVFYCSLPDGGRRKKDHALSWVNIECGDWAIDQPGLPIEQMRLEHPVDIVEKISLSTPLSTDEELAKEVPLYGSKFQPARGYHSNLTTCEIVFVRGLYPLHNTPFIVDGVGYAGTIVCISVGSDHRPGGPYAHYPDVET
ncbi:MAG: hypothetical protein AAF909_12355 [Pseudomonadota bacterium]